MGAHDGEQIDGLLRVPRDRDRQPLARQHLAEADERVAVGPRRKDPAAARRVRRERGDHRVRVDRAACRLDEPEAQRPFAARHDDRAPAADLDARGARAGERIEGSRRREVHEQRARCELREAGGGVGSRRDHRHRAVVGAEALPGAVGVEHRDERRSACALGTARGRDGHDARPGRHGSLARRRAQRRLAAALPGAREARPQRVDLGRELGDPGVARRHGCARLLGRRGSRDPRLLGLPRRLDRAPERLFARALAACHGPLELGAPLAFARERLLDLGEATAERVGFRARRCEPRDLPAQRLRFGRDPVALRAQRLARRARRVERRLGRIDPGAQRLDLASRRRGRRGRRDGLGRPGRRRRRRRPGRPLADGQNHPAELAQRIL